MKIVTAWKSKFSRCSFIQVPRSENSHTDSLAMLASVVDFQFRREIRVEYISKPSIHKSDEEVLRLDTSPGWRDPIVSYLKNRALPDDKAEAQKLQHFATIYILLGDLLYKKSYSKLYSDSYLRCLCPEEARKECRRSMMMIVGTMREVGLWLTKPSTGILLAKMFNNAKKYVKKCAQCQRFALSSNRLNMNLHTLWSPFHAVGARRGGPSSPSATPVQIPTGSHGLLHQVGGSGAILQRHGTTDSQISLAKHRMSAWALIPSSPTTGGTSPANR